MMPASEEAIRHVLDTIKDPCSVATSVPMGLSEMGIVKAVSIGAGGQVRIELRLTSPFCEMIAFMRNEAVARVSELPGVTDVSVTHDSGFDWDPDMIAPDAQRRRQARLAWMRTLLPGRASREGVQAATSG